MGQKSPKDNPKGYEFTSFGSLGKFSVWIVGLGSIQFSERPGSPKYLLYTSSVRDDAMV